MKMGIQMIEMYCNMVKEQFAPMMLKLDNHEKILREEAETEAKKELGIYELYLQKTKLEVTLREIEAKLRGYEDRNQTDYGYKNRIELLAEEKMQSRRNGLRKAVETAMKEMTWKIQMSGVSDDTKAVFESLPETIAQLTKKLDKLPAPIPKQMLK